MYLHDQIIMCMQDLVNQSKVQNQLGFYMDFYFVFQAYCAVILLLTMLLILASKGRKTFFTHYLCFQHIIQMSVVVSQLVS